MDGGRDFGVTRGVGRGVGPVDPSKSLWNGTRLGNLST